MCRQAFSWEKSVSRKKCATSPKLTDFGLARARRNSCALPDRYQHNILLDLFFEYFGARSSTLYVGLAQNSSNVQGYVIEPWGGGYARIPLSNSAAGFSEVEGGAMANLFPIVFPKPLSDWGVVQSVFIGDAFMEGHVVAMADLTTPQMLDGGSCPQKIAPGHLILRLL